MYSRLDLNQRILIQESLDLGRSFSSIAKSIGVHASTISREVFSNRTEKNTFNFGRAKSRCMNFSTCTTISLCPGMTGLCRGKPCRTCGKVRCDTICPDFKEEHCPLLNKAPFVCNHCEKRPRCQFRKQIYDAAVADRKSRTLRSESHSGISMSEDELNELNGIVSELIKENGQSIHHICISHPDEITVCERTLYNYVNKNLIDAKRIDMPRSVRLRPRKKKTPERKVDKQCRTGRTFEDYQDYLRKYPDAVIIEGDTVEGKKGGACILTITWKAIDFQIGIYRLHNNAASVTAYFRQLYKYLGKRKFKKIFPNLILLDNGSEFSDPEQIEKCGVKVFYCDPGKPNQKGTCENVHSMIRRILPKGTSFDDLDQDFFDLLFSHIDSYTRPNLNNKSAYDMFKFLYGDIIDIEDVFHIKQIPADEINLTPRLKKEFLKQKGS